jgi:hypothetical protein
MLGQRRDCVRSFALLAMLQVAAGTTAAGKIGDLRERRHHPGPHLRPFPPIHPPVRFAISGSMIGLGGKTGLRNHLGGPRSTSRSGSAREQRLRRFSHRAGTASRHCDHRPRPIRLLCRGRVSGRARSTAGCGPFPIVAESFGSCGENIRKTKPTVAVAATVWIRAPTGANTPAEVAPPTTQQLAKLQQRERRPACYQQVMDLHQQARSVSAISRTLDSRRAVPGAQATDVQRFTPLPTTSNTNGQRVAAMRTRSSRRLASWDIGEAAPWWPNSFPVGENPEGR